MGMKAQTSILTATGDTVKTLIDTITIFVFVRAIVGIWAYALAGAAMTTAEAITGILELESDDLPLVPLQLPLDCVSALTNGGVGFSPRVWNVNIPVKGQEKVKGYVTMDMAQTGALKARWGLIYAY